MTKIAIIILGPQGSGKGTQGKILAEKYGYFRFVMGFLLRKIVKEGGPNANKVAHYIDNGIYLPDNFLIEILDSELEIISKDHSMIFDGVPRKAKQAKYLINFLNHHNFKKIITLYIDIPKEETLRRLLLRAKTENRKDDTLVKIESRLRQNIKETLPILNFLKKETNFYLINGQGDINTVSQRIINAIGSELV